MGQTFRLCRHFARLALNELALFVYVLLLFYYKLIKTVKKCASTHPRGIRKGLRALSRQKFVDKRG